MDDNVEVTEVSPVEQEARSMGWSPKEEFRGDPEKWRPADEFVERGKNILPIVKENFERVSKKLDAVTRELDESRKTSVEFREFLQKSEKAKIEKAYRDGMNIIQQKQRAAVGDMDQDAYDALEAEKHKLYGIYRDEAEKIEEEVQAKQQQAPQFSDDQQAQAKAFVEANPWYGKNRTMTAYTAERSLELTDSNGDVDYKTLEKDVKARFPEGFVNPNREKETSGEAAGQTRKASGGKTFDDLPQSAKDSYNKFAKQFKVKGKEYTKAEYLKDYQWD